MNKEELIAFILANFYVDTDGSLQYYFQEDTPAVDITKEQIAFLVKCGITFHSKP